jgi:hypothetical protein
MQLGLRSLLLLVAVILFIVAAISNGDTAFDLVAIGLACVAGALLVADREILIGGRVGPSEKP